VRMWQRGLRGQWPDLAISSHRGRDGAK